MRSASLLASLSALFACVQAQVYCGIDVGKARQDNTIQWNSVPYTDAAFAYMQNLSLAQGPDPAANATGIDMHGHMVFPWYQQAVPITAGETTPSWSTEAHLTFAAQYGINHTILLPSAPSGNVYTDNPDATAATSRLINLSLAVLAACRPERFSWLGSMPLPWVPQAIAEMNYAMSMGASGLAVLSNHEGIYLGNSQLTPFWKAVNSRSSQYTVVHVHPNAPYLRENNGATLIEANPTRYISGLFEFFFETARWLMDCSYSGTLVNYPNINWVAAHVGGTFPSTLDRMIQSVSPSIQAQLRTIYTSRVFWDSAGPAYPRMVNGLLAFVNQSQLVLGTDFPYAPTVSYGPAIGGLLSDTNVDVPAIFHDNAARLLGSRLNWH